VNVKIAGYSLLVIGVVLVVGGITLSAIGAEIPEWLGKTIAIIVGALVVLAGGQAVRSDSADK
jgi:hypothetical protein